MYNLKKRFTKTVVTMALLLTVLMLPALKGQAANSYKQFTFPRKGSASELYTKNYSVYQITGGFKVVKKGKTVGTVKGNFWNVLYSDKDFYYSTYTGSNQNYKFTIYHMTAAGKSSKIGEIKAKGLFYLDAIYKNKIYGHYSDMNMSNLKSTNYVYSINLKTHKTAKVCSFDGNLGYVRGGDQSPVLAGGKLLFDAEGKAIVVDLANGKKETVSQNLKIGTGDIDTSVWKDSKTTYIEQENAIRKYNKKTKKFESDAFLEKYARNYSVLYADENAVLYEDGQVYYLYMRKAKKKTKLGKDVFSGDMDGISFVDGPAVKGKSLCFIVFRGNKSEIWTASIKSGKAKKVKTSTQYLRFRSDNKKIGYSLKDDTIKYIYTVK